MVLVREQQGPGPDSRWPSISDRDTLPSESVPLMTGMEFEIRKATPRRRMASSRGAACRMTPYRRRWLPSRQAEQHDADNLKHGVGGPGPIKTS